MSDDRYILDGKSFIDTKTNQCLNFGIKDLARVTITLNNMDMWLNQAEERISELEEQLANSIRPKFNRQEHICSFAFGEIREYIVVAYLDSNVTLCENIETSELEFCDNNFLVRTYEEAQAKLEELRGESDVKD